MPTPFTIQSEAMLDPRGAFRSKPVQLAPRSPSLKGKTVLLFDNSQMTSQLVNYGPIFRWLSAWLESKHGAKCAYQTENLLMCPKGRLGELAEEISKSGVSGVVVSLCNAGITQPTSVFALELERRGIPCVQMCTDLGYPLAGVTAASLVPGLPIILTRLASGDADSFGKAETEAVAADIAEGLTGDSGALLSRFKERFKSGSLEIAKDGVIELPDLQVPSTDSRVKVDPGHFSEKLYDAFCEAELGDGFPVIPPTRDRVEAMLTFTDLDPDLALLEEMPPSGGTVTVRSVAVNAVMAGCKPQYFPIVIAAFQAMSAPMYRAFQGAITTHPAGNAIVVSGPLADELGIASGPGCIGPGYRANATIGRAVNLTIMNVARAIPGKTDLAIFGSPAEYSYCFAESDRNNPWQPLHTDLYGPETTSVTVNKCEAPHNVLDPRGGPEDLLRVIAAVAATKGGNNLVHLGQILVMLNPDQAKMIAKAGWSKRDIKEFLFEVARHPIDFIAKVAGRAEYPPYFMKMQQVPVMRSPEDVILIVCGGKGTHAMVGVPWGLSKAVSRPVVLKDGTPIRTLQKGLRQEPLSGTSRAG